MRDNLFQSQPSALESFHFGAQVAEVFDDMVVRSVPHYDAIQELLVRFALRCCAGRPIYDLGCSTGGTLTRLARTSSEPLCLVGVDNSEAMLDSCRQKLASVSSGHTLHLENHDLEVLRDFGHGPAGAVILCLVLQFLRPPRRQPLLQLAFDHLDRGGCLLLVEKTVQKQPDLNSMFIDFYYDFKRQSGYSDLEIVRKREALENRLIPFRTEENLEMLQAVGFADPAIFFTALNFQGYVALKA